MRRSEVNAILDEGAAFIRGFGVALPPFAAWSPERMRAASGSDIHARGLGWDVTDYGRGRFAEMGLLLFTARNGRVGDLRRGRGMLYAEKVMVSRDGQLSPMHRHVSKAEDIVNRGGGDLVIELFASDADGGLDRTARVTVPSDGESVTLQAGGRLGLGPGASVTLLPGVWHAFWAEGGDCLVGEVSTVNDDRADNVFAEPLGRFPRIEEDAPPTRLLVSDYA